MDIHEMRDALQGVYDRMEELNELTITENRDFSEAEDSEYRGLESQADSYEKKIKREESIRSRRAAAPMPERPDTRNAPQMQVRDYDQRDFSSLGEFLFAVRFRQSDQRLRGVEQREADAQAMGDGLHDSTDGPLGGYAVPEQFRAELLEVAQQGAIIRPRAFVIPAGSPPDAPIFMPALDQTDSRNRYGGVEVQWIEEAGTKPQTDFNLRQVELQPYEVAGHIVINDKLLRNWQAADAVSRRLLAGAITSATDTAFLTGDGDGKPQGFIGSSATYTVNRAEPNAIGYADVAAMYSRMLMGGSPVWIASQSILPQLLTMVDGDGRYIFQPGAREGVQPQLLGFPIIWSERTPALGTAGDLSFVDLQYYLIKDGSGPFVAASEHVHFTTNQTVIKTFFNVDGKPWLTAPMQLENGYAVSPFVVLDVPAGDGDGDGDGDG
jgi:HK97 family phage major capsid protein